MCTCFCVSRPREGALQSSGSWISYLELRDGGNTLPFIPALYCYCKATFFCNCTVSFSFTSLFLTHSHLFQSSVTFACAFHVRNFDT